MIKLQVIGNLGKDALVNNVNGKSVINFTVAHSEKYKDRDGNAMDKTTWVDCAYWTDRTAIAPYLKKGTQVYVEGAPDVKMFGKAEDTKCVLTLRVSSVQLLGGKTSDAGTGRDKPGMANENELTEPLDDLPF